MLPHSRGKTTLLKHLAARKIPLPAGVDVLLVEQEVLPSEESVVTQVSEWRCVFVNVVEFAATVLL